MNDRLCSDTFCEQNAVPGKDFCYIHECNNEGCQSYASQEEDYCKEHRPDKAYDPVNHPKHYTSHPSGIECIQITRHMGFNLGNAMKYVWRADLKNDSIEDMKKAIWYIEDEIKKRENNGATTSPASGD